MRVSDRIKISKNICQIARIARSQKLSFRALAKKRGDQSQKERKIAELAVIFFVFNKEIQKRLVFILDEPFCCIGSK